MRKFLLGLMLGNCGYGLTLPPVWVVPQSSDEGEGLEAILHKIRAFLLLHVKIDVSDVFLSPVSCDKLVAEFRRLCKEGAGGILLDLYSATVLLLTFYMLKDRFYQLDKDFVRKFEKTVCYILDREKEIACRYVSSEAFHRSIADLAKQGEKEKVTLPIEPVGVKKVDTLQSVAKTADAPNEPAKVSEAAKTTDPEQKDIDKAAPVQSIDTPKTDPDPLAELNKLIEISEKAPYPIEPSADLKSELLIKI